MEVKKVYDRFGNELECGDYVCFTASSGNWRETPDLVRVKVYALCSDKKGDWIIPENNPACPVLKVLASRVIKCY